MIKTYNELLHHRLRINHLFHFLNAAFTCKQIRKKIAPYLNQKDIIINFNYDYYFLRYCFPNNKIITFLNDNSWSSPIRFAEKSYKQVLKKTLESSSAVFSVSKNILNQVFVKKRKVLFHPWAQGPYQQPKKSIRDTILYFGFLNRRLDLKVLKSLAIKNQQQKKGFKIVLVGPLEQNQKELLELKKYKTVIIKKPKKAASEVNWDNVLCGLIPYRSGVPENDAIELPNKAMKFFVRGIPLLISGMPNFLRKPFIYRIESRTGEFFFDVFDKIKKEFTRNQSLIKKFVQENSQAQRFKTLLHEVRDLSPESDS
jgi:hypothetical protein